MVETIPSTNVVIFTASGPWQSQLIALAIITTIEIIIPIKNFLLSFIYILLITAYQIYGKRINAQRQLALPVSFFIVKKTD